MDITLWYVLFKCTSQILVVFLVIICYSWVRESQQCIYLTIQENHKVTIYYNFFSFKPVGPNVEMGSQPWPKRVQFYQNFTNNMTFPKWSPWAQTWSVYTQKFLECKGLFGLLHKIKKGSWFFNKNVPYLHNTLSIDKVSMSYLFSFS